MTPIGDILNRYQTDKNTNHSYGPVYDKLFADRDAVRNVMEVGIASGGCLLAWRDVFPNAQIVGFDMEPCHSEALGSEDATVYPITPRPSRIEIVQGDMKDRSALMRAVRDRQFDIIIEDATHRLHDNLRTLFWLWPHLAPGGLYVIEEMESPHSHLECLALFRGVEVHTSPPPIEGELLVVLRKAQKRGRKGKTV